MIEKIAEPMPDTPQQAARWILLSLLMDVRPDWNGAGTRLWAEYKLKELEDE